jgi:hypothetical protein
MICREAGTIGSLSHSINLFFVFLVSSNDNKICNIQYIINAKLCSDNNIIYIIMLYTYILGGDGGGGGGCDCRGGAATAKSTGSAAFPCPQV